MNDIGQLRIYVSDRYFPLYHELSGNYLFGQNSEFFIYCVCVGEKYGQKQSLTKRHELCRAITLTDYDKTVLKALYVKERKTMAPDAKAAVSLAEEYAEGGLMHLIEEVLSDHVVVYDDGVYHLKTQDDLELQMALSEFVLKELREVPF